MLKLKDYSYPIELLKLRRFLSKSELFSKEELINFQNKNLQKIIHYAYDNVPYYKELFNNNGINPNDIKSTQDLQIIPVLTKDILRERFDDLISIQYEKYRPYISQTSGSTGTPLKFFLDKNVNIAKFSFLWRAWNWAGYKIGQKMAILEGTPMPDEKLYFYDIQLNALRIPSFKMSQQNSKIILKKLIKFSPKMIRAYPSAIYEFAKLIADQNDLKPVKSIKTIVTISETLSDYQREYIEKVFKCNVYDCYHQWESVCMISECSFQQKHHHMEYGILEMLDQNNLTVPNDTTGEIVATGFYNLSMPLIRYKTRDIAVKSNNICSCGINHDVISFIDGRIEDYVLTPDGRNVMGLTNSFKYNKGFDYAQVIQNEINSIEVRLVKNDLFDDNEVAILDKHLRERIGNEMEIQLKFVNKIDRQPNGKIRLVVNNILNKKTF